MTFKPILDETCLRDAVEISQYALEITRHAYWTRDKALFTSRFMLPQTIGSFQGDVLLETQADLEALFDRTCSYFDSNGIIDLDRRVIAATFIAEDLVQSTFVSRHVLKGPVFAPEIVAHGTLRLSEGRWKIDESRYATDSIPLSQALTGPKRR